MRYRIPLIFFIITLTFFTPAVISCAHDIKDGIQAVNVQNFKKAHEIFLTLANENCVDAMWSLAMMYYEGIGIEEDHVKAFTWFENAAGRGDPDSMNFIGFMYESGNGIEKNLDQAMAWYEKAVEKGSVDAMYSLCILQMRLENNIESYMWYLLADHYEYDCAEDEREAVQDALRVSLQKEQLMMAHRQANRWIRNHPDHNSLIKKLHETGPSCQLSPLRADILVTPSLASE